MKLLVIAALCGMVGMLAERVRAQEFSLEILPPKLQTKRPESIDLRKLKPGPKPFLTDADVLRYEADSHRLVFTYDARSRLRDFKVSAGGLSFAVFAGSEAIYVGRFFEGYTDVGYRGVAVDISTLRQPATTLLFELDYPPLAPKNPATDPRGDERLLKALERSGKLYREVWLEAKCTGARGTGKRRQSFVFEFNVEKAVKGDFPNRSIDFEVYFDAGGIELFDAVGRNDGAPGASKFLLKFQRQAKETNPNMWYQGFERID